MQARISHTRSTTMRTRTAAVLMGVIFLVVSSTARPGYAGSDSASEPTLLDTLHNKGVITDQEYEQLKQKDTATDKVLKFLGGISIGTLSYFEMVGGEADDESFAEFRLTRGYINISKQLTSWLGFRITPDAYQAANGDFNLRLKYLYAEFIPPNLSFVTDMRAEVGIGHVPWLDFEEKVNPYRCQGTMFIERAGIFNSADLGVNIRGYWGGQLGGEYQTNVGKYYAGRWGSWHIGVYNGGGYHADEVNMNKVPEWRFTVRPLPDLVPGLQLSYFGLWGKGNANLPVNGVGPDTLSPDYQVQLGMVSYQNAWITLTGQYAYTVGNAEGDYVVYVDVGGVPTPTPEALFGQGFSFFFNGKVPYIPHKQLNVFARWDYFNPDMDHLLTTGDAGYNLAFAGVAWEFFPHWYFLVDYQRTMYQPNNGGVKEVPVEGLDLPDAWQVQGVLQIEF